MFFAFNWSFHILISERTLSIRASRLYRSRPCFPRRDNVKRKPSNVQIFRRWELLISCVTCRRSGDARAKGNALGPRERVNGYSALEDILYYSILVCTKFHGSWLKAFCTWSFLRCAPRDWRATPVGNRGEGRGIKRDGGTARGIVVTPLSRFFWRKSWVAVAGPKRDGARGGVGGKVLRWIEASKAAAARGQARREFVVHELSPGLITRSARVVAPDSQLLSVF